MDFKGLKNQREAEPSLVVKAISLKPLWKRPLVRIWEQSDSAEWEGLRPQ